MTLKELTKLWKSFSYFHSQLDNQRFKLWQILEKNTPESEREALRMKLSEASKALWKCDSLMSEIIEPHFGRLYRNQIERELLK